MDAKKKITYVNPSKNLNALFNYLIDLYGNCSSNELISLTTFEGSAFDKCKKRGDILLTKEDILDEMINIKKEELNKANQYKKVR